DCRTVPDGLPILSVLGTFARGPTMFENVAHVRLKESDRVSAMLQLNRMGGRLELRGDRLVCEGVGHLTGADLSSFNDHRVLMSLAVAASCAEGESRITYPNAYRISYPRFLDEMNAVGVPMAVESASRQGATSHPRRPVTPDQAAAVPISEYVRRWVHERPDQPAVVAVAGDGEDRVWSWRELDAEADATASALRDLGVSAGEVVAFQLPNLGEFVVLVLAIMRIGAVCCPLMPIFREREMAFVLHRSKARVLVIPERFRGRDYCSQVANLLAGPREARPALEHVVVVGGEGALAGAGAGTGTGARTKWHRFSELVSTRAGDMAATGACAATPDQVVQLLFTSGTSGEPKGVLHRMDVLTRAAAMEIRHLGLSDSERVFVPSPLAHQTGFLYGMWLSFVLGAPQILQATWDGHVALSAVRRWGVTFVQAATPFLADLVSAVEESGARPESLRIFVATGAAVPRGLAEQATRTLEAAVCGAWGTTETCLGSLAAPSDEPAKVWGTDGRALDEVRLRITDDRGNILAAGQEGNFEVYSKCLFVGYLDHPDWTAETMTPDGWYRSGDLAVIDDSGYVRISGRVKDVINRGGEKVPVGEIEQLLHTHPAVKEAAIVSMPDARLGERACAFVVLSGELDFSGMQAFLDKAQVARQYWPERLEAIEVLPRNATGKVQKFVLRDAIAQIIEKEGRQ
ncbi:MAG: AMP-binding protein, partial [Acidimicrobiales bacterium]